MEAKLVVAKDEAHFRKVVLEDAMGSIEKALLTLEGPGKEADEHFRRYVNSSGDQWMYLVYVLNREHKPATTGMVVQLTGAFLDHYQLVLQTLDTVEWLKELDAAWQERTGPDAMLLQKIFYTLLKVQQFWQEELRGPEIYLEIGQLFKFIAQELTSSGADGAALSQMFTAINFLVVGDAEQAIAFSRECIVTNETRLVAELPGLLAIYLNLLCREVVKDEGYARETYLAAERLLVMQLQTGEPFEPALGDFMFRSIQEFAFLKPLLILYYHVKGREAHYPAGIRREDLPDVGLLIRQTWTEALPEWVRDVLLAPGSLASEWENFNYDLRKKNIRPEVKFNNLSLLHNKFMEAVPLSTSFLREKDKNQVLLELKHELTHVYSLFGRIGVTLNALRVMLAEQEKILLFTHYSLEDNDPALAASLIRNYIRDAKPTELIRPDLHALVYTECSAILELKIRVLEQIWSPWLEGIAVFGELTDDPTLDEHVESPVSTVVKNLVDKTFEQYLPDQEKFMAEHQAHLKLMEGLQAEALEKDGFFRLWSYLTDHHQKYLPGYLAVRKLVGGWRSKTKRQLRGDLAYRLLLHVTRFSLIDILPDLCLPLEEFTQTAKVLHLDWLSQLADLDESDLESFLGSQDTQAVRPCSWIDGRLSFDTTKLSGIQEAFEQRLEARSREFVAGTAAQILDRQAATGLDEAVQAHLRLVARSVVGSSVLLASREFTGAFDHHSVLALGEVSSPFWLVGDTPTFVSYIRTRDKNIKERTAHYTMYTFPINKKDFEYLAKTARETGEIRVKVFRAVVLGGREDQLANGHQFLVFKYASWLDIQQVGLVQGRKIPEDTLNLLKDRFGDDGQTALREFLIGPGQPCCKRTLDYLEGNSWDAVSFESVFTDAQSWAEQVKKACREVLSEDMTALEDISLELLRWSVENDELAAQLFTSGLRGLARPGLSLNDLIQFVFRSGLLPITDGKEAKTAQKLNQSQPEFCKFAPGGWDVLRP